jgi:transcriptional regulator GlxA family with amidase domain
MEERIINLAIAGKVDELDETVTRLFEQNAARRVAKEDLNELILHLNGTAHRALERLELSADALLAESPGTVQGTVPGTGAHLSDRQNYVRRFLGAIARTARAARARPRLDRIIEYVSEHYDEDLYLEGLADRFGVSYRYLSRTLRVKLGMPFHRYLSLLRIRRATELLTTTSVRVKDVASCVGFQSDKTFFRTFKSIQGVTPSEMRRMHGHEANRREVSEDYRAQVASPDYSVRIHASNGT